jgi:hypothetical protein
MAVQNEHTNWIGMYLNDIVLTFSHFPNRNPKFPNRQCWRGFQSPIRLASMAAARLKINSRHLTLIALT